MHRRRFLLATAASLAAASLPRARATAGLYPAAPNAHASAAARVLVSGGTITKDGKFLPPVTAAHRAHYGDRKKILLVLHASHPDARDEAARRLQAVFATDGYAAESLHRLDPAAAREKISRADAFFVSGGETFLLLRTLLELDQLAPLRARVLAGAPYHGTSAGANLAGPVIGCTNDFPVVDVPTRAALGVFPAVLNPHHPRAGEPEHAARVAKIKGYLRFNPAETVLGLANGTLARLSAGRASIAHGPAFLYRAAVLRELADGPFDFPAA